MTKSTAEAVLCEKISETEVCIMMKKIKWLLLGLLIGLSITLIGAFASSSITKELFYNNIKIMLNNSEVTPTDANGNYVEPFIIDGTTYLPVRGVANALGLDVKWDGDTNTVLLSTKEAPRAEDYVDFVVNVKKGRDPVILHLTDTQIEDSSQLREGTTFSKAQTNYWLPELMDERVFNDLNKIIKDVNPDLILITGDLVYGKYDDAGTSFTKLADFIDGYNIPWAPVFGNHDNESKKGADWQCAYLENCKNCLFEQKTLTGNGNYSIGIVQGGELKRVIFMLDSNGCSAMSDETFNNGHSKKTAGFGKDQIQWYTDAANKINSNFSDVEFTFAFHIQIAAFADALYETYSFVNGGETNSYGDLVVPLNIDEHENKKDTDFGYVGRSLKGPWDADKSVYNGMKALGADSILVGHEHCNSASVVYDGIRFQFGQKIGEYDRINFKSADGTIIGAGAYSTQLGSEIIGGTVLVMSEDTGEFKDAYIYYCEDDEKTEKKTTSENTVSGLSFDKGDLKAASAIEVSTVTLEGENVYKFTAKERGKIYISAPLVANKSTFSFEVMLPEGDSYSNSGMVNYGEFAIRVKPNEIEPTGDGLANGYLVYSSKSDIDGCKLIKGTWQKFTIDISNLGADCTEFAFEITAPNTIYVKNIEIK